MRASSDTEEEPDGGNSEMMWSGIAAPPGVESHWRSPRELKISTEGLDKKGSSGAIKIQVRKAKKGQSNDDKSKSSKRHASMTPERRRLS